MRRSVELFPSIDDWLIDDTRWMRDCNEARLMRLDG